MARSLGEVVAIEKSARQRANTKTAALYKAAQAAQKSNTFVSLARTYTPDDDEGQQLPFEGSSTVQEKAEDMLAAFAEALTKSLDLAAMKDEANTNARGSVVVDDETILSDVPVSHLLYLEHQLDDVNTFISALPVLDPAVQWSFNDETGQYESLPWVTVRSEKHEVPLVLYPHSEKHPAQVKTTVVENPVGKWRHVRYSGALSLKRKAELLAKVAKLQDAVKIAREEANRTAVQAHSTARELFGYLLS